MRNATSIMRRGCCLDCWYDTIERRRGKRISAKGIDRDPVRSSHGHFGEVVPIRGPPQMKA